MDAETQNFAFIHIDDQSVHHLVLLRFKQLPQLAILNLKDVTVAICQSAPGPLIEFWLP